MFGLGSFQARSSAKGLRRACGVALCAALTFAAAVPAAAQTTTTYSNTTTGTIDGSTTCTAPLVRNFSVGTSFTVSDVDLGMLAAHTWRGDIRLTLQSPAGTRVQLVDGDSASTSGDNFNVRLNDEGTQVVNTDSATGNHSTTAPPYENNFQPNSGLSAFDGENSLGTWRLEICDIFPSADNGTFRRADLYLTSIPPNVSDMSLTKAVSSTTPSPGTTIAYTLSLSNAAGGLAASNVTVLDTLPAGVSFLSSTGDGSYNSSTGIWSIPAIAAGQTLTLTINVTVTATTGTTVTNSAEVQSSPNPDPDSTPGNGSTTEDDDDRVNFTVTASGGGTPPAFSCPAGATIFDWDAVTWTAGTLSNSYALTNIGTVGFTVTAPSGAFLNNATFGGQTPAESTYYNAGLYPGQQALHYLIDVVDQTQSVTTTVTLANSAQAARFIISDIDDGGTQFRDQLIVTGSFQGTSVIPILTNGSANVVAGNVATGTAAAANNVQDGNVIVTFQSPVDQIVFTYGPSPTGPAAPGQQGIGIHDMTLCNPLADIDVNKTSIVYDSGAGETFNIPGNDVLYTISVSNTARGPTTVDSLFVYDALPAAVTFFNGDANGAGAGSDPVIFADSGSGLSWTYANDVAYSNAGTPPASFAACTYTPAAGYDPNVRYVCINPKGIMNGTSGGSTPSFTLSFRGRID